MEYVSCWPALISVNAWTQQPSWDVEAAEHADILAAARRGDTDAATELVLNHIRSFEARAVGQLARPASHTG